MKSIDWKLWKKERAARFRRAIELENSFHGRAAGRRPRDPEKEKLLADLDKARWKRYIESGKLEALGPRKWKWRVDFTDYGEAVSYQPSVRKRMVGS